MKVVRRSKALALLAASTMVLAACGGGREATSSPGQTGTDGASVQADPGITDTEIKLGGTYPLSGNASAYAAIGKGATAFFNEINANGGVQMGDGKTRKINFLIRDDGYTPARAVEETKRLVEQEQVFAMFNTLGTPSNTAIWDYLNQQKVPHLFVATGASKWGADIEKHPWTTGWQPAYPTESAIYAQYLKDTKPNAKVAVLFQNDDYGKDYLDGFKQAIEGSSVTIVSEQPYAVTDATVDSQMTNLARTNADTFFNITTPKFAAQAIKKKAELNWPAEQLLNVVSNSISSVLKPAGLEASKGIVSAQYLKEPTDPQWANDPAMIEYREAIAKHGGGANPDDPYTLFGRAVGRTMVDGVLKNMKTPTRQAAIDAARNLPSIQQPLMLPGVKVKTGPNDGFPIEAMQLSRFNGERFERFGEVIDFEGKTPIPEA